MKPHQYFTIKAPTEAEWSPLLKVTIPKELNAWSFFRKKFTLVTKIPFWNILFTTLVSGEEKTFQQIQKHPKVLKKPNLV